MATRAPLLVKGKVGRLDGVVYYTSQGRTIARPITEVSNPRTLAQMLNRVAWGNIVQCNKYNAFWNNKSISTRKAGVHALQSLMQINLHSEVKVYLTKEQNAAGCYCCAPYLITRGDLPSISFEKKASGRNFWYESNIVLSQEIDFDTTTVAQFSKDILANNPLIHEGWQLSLIRNICDEDAVGPRHINHADWVVLDTKNSALLTDYLAEGLIFSKFESGATKGVIAIEGHPSNEAFTMLWSANIKGRIHVSTQRFTLMSYTLYNKYCSADQLQKSLESYGYTDTDFLNVDSSKYSAKAVEVTNGIVAYTLGAANTNTFGDESAWIDSARKTTLAQFFAGGFNVGVRLATPVSVDDMELTMGNDEVVAATFTNPAPGLILGLFNSAVIPTDVPAVANAPIKELCISTSDGVNHIITFPQE